MGTPFLGRYVCRAMARVPWYTRCQLLRRQRCIRAGTRRCNTEGVDQSGLTVTLSRPPDEYSGVSRHERLAQAKMKNRSERAVGCSECWAERPGWTLLGRHTPDATTLALPSTRTRTARIAVPSRATRGEAPSRAMAKHTRRV
jgi:hypothetical protein